MNGIHILFLTDNFPPEGNAPATRTFEHAKIWVELGNKVTIITCVPNFPEGKVYEGYSNKLFQKETIEGIDVRRVKTFISANEGFLLRSLDYMSFMVAGFIAGLFVKKPDVVIATSPQFFCACSGWMLAFVRRKPFVFELRDMWPASIKAVGVSKNSRLMRLLERLEMFLYRRASLIITVTNSFRDELGCRGIDTNKIKVVLNGVDLSVYQPREKKAELVQKHSLNHKFVVGYIGTHGLAHALETIIDTAGRLESNEKIVFLFAGGGAKVEILKEQVAARGLGNVVMLGRQPKADMPAIWSLCDISIVHLRNTPLFSKVIPSKIFESFAMGLPVVIGLPKGEATELVRSNDSGIVIEPENPDAMASAIVGLEANREELRRLAKNCARAAQKYDRKHLALSMLSELEQIVCH